MTYIGIISSLRCVVNITTLHHRPQQNNCCTSRHRRYPQTGGLKRSPSGDDFAGKREFFASNNIAIKITEPLAGTAANGSAAADEETVGAGTGAAALALALALVPGPAAPML